MKRRFALTGSAVAIVAIGIAVVLLWPAGDPLAGVETVAVQGPNWGDSPQRGVIEGPFLRGLEVTLGDKRITIVGRADEADAILAIKEVKLGRIEVLIQGGEIRGRASATCTLTDLRTGEEHVMDFYLTLEKGSVEARLVARRFWQVWK